MQLVRRTDDLSALRHIFQFFAAHGPGQQDRNEIHAHGDRDRDQQAERVPHMRVQEMVQEINNPDSKLLMKRKKIADNLNRKKRWAIWKENLLKILGK